MSKDQSPGMDIHEWRYREGAVVTEHGLAVGDEGLAVDGLIESVTALRDSFRVALDQQVQPLVDQYPDIFDPEKVDELHRMMRAKLKD